MFQFSGLPPIAGFLIFNQEGCPIRKSADHRFLTPSRSLSQLSTSFIDSESQGIRRVLLITFISRVLFLLYVMLLVSSMSKNITRLTTS